QQIVEEGKMSGTVILLLDEIHRLDKAKQDFLLPHLEKGTIILIGATTSNPYHAINTAIRSRTQIFELYLLYTEDVQLAVSRALERCELVLGNQNIKIDQDAMDHLISSSQGDVRSALNALELAAISTKPADDVLHITLDDAKACMQ